MSPQVEDKDMEARLYIRPCNLRLAPIPTVGVEAMDEDDGAISRRGKEPAHEEHLVNVALKAYGFGG